MRGVFGAANAVGEYEGLVGDHAEFGDDGACAHRESYEEFASAPVGALLPLLPPPIMRKPLSLVSSIVGPDDGHPVPPDWVVDFFLGEPFLRGHFEYVGGIAVAGDCC